ncbi:class I SAM-dependent methyltransferase [Microbacterium sp. 10M-3C3]|jgi:SAM-dependent methyltransferase|uniref:class I SAM-dependent methyltransferase n=1 Tax=Microbacterium sp. 10M-3C3 TaxID=2483401 RepID=UPI000F62EA31|nr:class I SAM-dependent methyltransferase [Microbacterium sp. 10M-3C3]
MASREEMSTSFGAVAAEYEAGRPGYPAEAIAWLLEPVRAPERPARVADVGAGTGKLTRVAVELGAEVVAIDPDAAMLETLRTHVAGVPTFVGRAESLPLPDAAVDAVLFGQAWHWVDVAAASAEVGRVVRAGGVLGMVWNIRDDRVPWVAELSAVMHGSHAEEVLSEEGGVAVAAPFADIERERWEWSRAMTRADLLAMARSRSYIVTAAPDERARIEAALGDLLDRVGAVGEATVELPYVTHAFRSIRP